jgi:16S rRNA processing protein RimM
VPAPAPCVSDPTAVAVGEIVGAHGLRGLVRVRAYQPPAPSLVAEREVLVEHGGQCRAVRVTAVVRQGRGRVLLGLAGVADRSAAEAFAGARLLVRRADLPPPAADEFYYHEVVGFTVETLTGAALGTVSSTLPTGLNDVWIVHDGGREHLIPVIADVVRLIDRAGRRIVIDPLPGLLD